MAGSVNKVILVGNIGQQPEIRVAQASGEELATFSLATNEKWKDKNTGEPREKTEWHRVVVFAPGLVTVIKNYANKGSKLYIEGQMQTREYEDQSGTKKYTTEVVLNRFNSTLVLLDSKADSQGFAGLGDIKKEPLIHDQKKELEDAPTENDINHDEIPF